MQATHCTNCGKPLLPDAAFCANCGAPRLTTPPAAPAVAPVVAAAPAMVPAVAPVAEAQPAAMPSSEQPPVAAAPSPDTAPTAESDVNPNQRWIRLLLIAGLVLVFVIAGIAVAFSTTLVGGSNPPPGSLPTVSMQATGCGVDICSATVTTVSTPRALSSFEVEVRVDGVVTAIPATLLVANIPINGGGLELVYNDLLGEGDMSSGDSLTLLGVVPGTEYEIEFTWESTGQVVEVLTLRP